MSRVEKKYNVKIAICIAIHESNKITIILFHRTKLQELFYHKMQRMSYIERIVSLSSYSVYTNSSTVAYICMTMAYTLIANSGTMFHFLSLFKTLLTCVFV